MKVKLGTFFFFGQVFRTNKQNKGKVMMRKLGQKTKSEDKEDVKVEKEAEHVEVDSKIKVSSVGITGRYSLFSKEEKL